jgi:15-cis-phytoene desaturase
MSPLHKPAKTISSFIGNLDYLSIAEKTVLIKFIIAGSYLYVKNPHKLDAMTVKELAVKQGVPQATIEKLLIPLSEGIFFLPIEQYSAYAFFGLFLPYITRLLQTRIGAFMGGMSEVMIQPMADYIERRGGEIHTNAEVSKILISNNQANGVEIKDGTALSAHAVVLAASLAPAQQILQQSTTDPSFTSMLSLLSMPSVTLQLELSRPAIEVDRTTFGPMTVLASFSEQSRTTFQQTNGRLSIILSSPNRFIHMEKQDILNIVMDDAKRIGIMLDGNIKRYRKIAIMHDFYMLSPSSDRLRPTQHTNINNLSLAGDYTRQKYLATMEGAVYSGILAAKDVDKYL